jgi:hypothetical protein
VVGDCAFADCSELRSLTLTREGGPAKPGTTAELAGGTGAAEAKSTIGADAFRGCAGLVEAEGPPGIASIGDGAFAGCGCLTRLSVRSSLKSVGACVFEGATTLHLLRTGFRFPDPVQDFAEYLRATGEWGQCFGPDGGLLAYAAGYFLPLSRLPTCDGGKRTFLFQNPAAGALKALTEMSLERLGKFILLNVEALPSELPGVTPSVDIAAWLLTADGKVVVVMVNLLADEAKDRIRLPYIDGVGRSLRLCDLHSDEFRERTREQWAGQGCVFKVRGGGARIWVDSDTFRSLTATLKV